MGMITPKKTIDYLYKESDKQLIQEDYLNDNIDYKFSLKTPQFLYEVKNRMTNRIRAKVNIDSENIKNFWRDNVSYKLIKPNNIESLIIWIKAMFFNKSFFRSIHTIIQSTYDFKNFFIY